MGSEKQAWTKEPWVAVPINGKSEYTFAAAKSNSDGRWVLMPEWNIERLPLAVIDRADDQYPPERTRAGADAARIVSCVNALTGKPDPQAWVKAVERLVEWARVFSVAEATDNLCDEIYRELITSVLAVLALQSPREEEKNDE